jgi:hypothetical protein
VLVCFISLANFSKNNSFFDVLPRIWSNVRTQVKKFHKHGMRSTLVSTTWGSGNVKFIRLDAQQWTGWLTQYRQGAEPEQLTRVMLGSNWKQDKIKDC